MASPRLASQTRRLDDEPGGLEHVQLLGGARWKSLADLIELRRRLLKAARASRDPRVFPHDRSNAVRRHLRSTPIRERRNLPSSGLRHTRELFCVREIAG